MQIKHKGAEKLYRVPTVRSDVGPEQMAPALVRKGLAKSLCAFSFTVVHFPNVFLEHKYNGLANVPTLRRKTDGSVCADRAHSGVHKKPELAWSFVLHGKA